MASEKPSDERAKSRNFAALRPLFGYLKPYRWRIAGAAVALLVAASTVLAMGAGLRFLIDRGFVSGDEVTIHWEEDCPCGWGGPPRSLWKPSPVAWSGRAAR